MESSRQIRFKIYAGLITASVIYNLLVTKNMDNVILGLLVLPMCFLKVGYEEK